MVFIISIFFAFSYFVNPGKLYNAQYKGCALPRQTRRYTNPSCNTPLHNTSYSLHGTLSSVVSSAIIVRPCIAIAAVVVRPVISIATRTIAIVITVAVPVRRIVPVVSHGVTVAVVATTPQTIIPTLVKTMRIVIAAIAATRVTDIKTTA